VRDTKEFREQHIARPNNKLIVADMGQQETRIGAYFSQDKALINILQDRKQDVFVGMARLVYKRDITKDDPFRKQVKNTTYGIFYGMSPEGMAERYGMPVDDAERAIDDVFNAFPDLYSWITQQKKKRDYVETVMGRRIWLNPHSDQVERNAVNSPISGTAADQMKIALGNIYEKWSFPVPYTCVGYIHDELIFDQLEKYADEIGEFISQEMISAAERMCVGIPFIADFKVCSSWAEKE
jgi:DNA polymerase I